MIQVALNHKKKLDLNKASDASSSNNSSLNIQMTEMSSSSYNLQMNNCSIQ